MKRKYTAAELERLHGVLYEILGVTDRICRKHGIPYFVIGGTAIGALYDKAILPWDDDVDIGMTRDAYNRFLEVAPLELGNDYFLQWTGSDPSTPYYFAKVRKNGTLFMEELFSHLPMHQGIYIDIFPFDRIPDSPALMKMQRAAVNFLKCCLLGKEIWLWKYFGTPATPEPSSRGALPCLLNRIVDTLFTKKAIYKCMVAVQSMFNRCNTKYYNNVITKTDHVEAAHLRNLQPVEFGPLTLLAPEKLEHFLRYNYPSLHRFTPEEQEAVSNHCPARLSFGNEDGK